MPRFWLYTQIAIVAFVVAGMIIALTFSPDVNRSTVEDGTPSNWSWDRALWTAAVCAACSA